MDHPVQPSAAAREGFAGRYGDLPFVEPPCQTGPPQAEPNQL